MESNKEFEAWLLEKKKNRRQILTGAVTLIILGLSAYGYGWTVIGIFMVAISIAFSYDEVKLPTLKDFQAEKKAEEEEEQEKLRKARYEKKVKEAKAKEKTDAQKKITLKVDAIEKNFKKLMSIDCPKPTEFKDNISHYENDISTKGSPEYLHKFVKVSAFLDDLWSHLVDTRQAMRDEFDPVVFEKQYKQKKRAEKNPSFSDTSIALDRLAAGDFKDYSADGLLKRLNDSSKSAVDEFSKEIAQVFYLEAMANSMLIFLLEGKQIYFFEILELFDKLGALDSSWQKSLSKKMSDISSKMDLLVSGISNLNDSINRLIDKNDDVLKQLQSIDSGLTTNNVLQAITAYKVHKISKNTRRIN